MAIKKTFTSQVPEFKALIGGEKHVIVLFGEPGTDKYKAISTTIDTFSEKNPQLDCVKVEIQELFDAEGVKNLPTTNVYLKGERVDTLHSWEPTAVDNYLGKYGDHTAEYEKVKDSLNKASGYQPKDPYAGTIFEKL